MSQWKKVKIDFKTIKLGDYIEPIKTTVAELNLQNPIVYGVTNKEGIVQTGKPASKDISNYIVLEENCFAFNPYRINVGSIGINDKNLTGCVSPAYVVFKTKNGLLPKFLFFYLKSDYGIHLINWYGNRGGVRNALRYFDLCNIDIPDIRNINQELLLQKFSSVSENINQITQELETQKEYIKQLRQDILQDAIEGKLTSDWRKTHPIIKGNPDYDTEALFEKIQKEKASDKKQKQLSPITDEEKPFKIPEGWIFTRLGEISEIVRGGSPRPAGDKTYYDGDIPFLKVADLTGSNEKELYQFTYTIKEAGLKKTRLVEKETLMLTNSGATLGIPKICMIQTTFNDGIAAFLGIHERILKDYLYYFLKSKTKWFLKEAAKGQGQPNLNTDIVSGTILPLPPLKEQEEIVNKIESLLTKVTELENQIQERKTLSEKLAFGIIKEKLAG